MAKLMRASTKRIKRAMAAKGISLDELAQEIGIKPRSLINIIHGTAQSRAMQQRLTNFFQIKFFSGTDVTERVVSLPVGTIIALPDENSIKLFIQQAGALCHGFSANATRLEISTELHFRVAGQKIPPLVRNHPAPIENKKMKSAQGDKKNCSRNYRTPSKTLVHG